ncbi:hypothetical protein THAOC_22967 [Thalassiosira oceanica]|uniref:Uncharacterized protein n=1 Tax=Thalassiosira oceanica TaxID=159749 RepID=K0RVL9_THAOC|nr:hypothetical protein THAOC_22967 [Thalassiosira oceanica]|eukprot:EJK57035.1 hypothetical protein THAOC_22967 [Thalassiosira oceanica]
MEAIVRFLQREHNVEAQVSQLRLERKRVTLFAKTFIRSSLVPGAMRRKGFETRAAPPSQISPSLIWLIIYRPLRRVGTLAT